MRNPELAELIGNATRRAFVKIIDLCLDEQVDSLLLAGDLYDGDQTSMKTARFFSEQIRRLHEARIQVFIVRGNHDALSRITKELTFPESVKIFGGRSEAVMVDRTLGDSPIAIHGLSFAQPHAPESLVGKYKPAVEGAANIGILHTSLGGAPGHDPYAPCSVADLQRTGFDYWALGHVHKRMVVQGKCSVVMPGMPQGRDINEAGSKSVTLVTISDDRSIQIEERVTSIAQFERLAVDVTGLQDWRDLVGALSKAMEHSRAGVSAEHLVARIRLTGATPLAWRIRNDLDLLKAEIDDRAAVIGACWIEKLEIACDAQAVSANAGDNPIEELRRLIDDEVILSEAYQAEVISIVEELRGQLPSDCRNILGSTEEAFQAAVVALVREGADDVLARLHSGSSPRDL